MATVRQMSVERGDVVVMVGTMKGAFLYRSDARRNAWEQAGPFFLGQPVYAMAYDGRAGRTRLWAATKSWHFGSIVQSSDDFGKNWTRPEQAPIKFPEDTGAELKQIWQIEPGRESEPDVIYCGVEPAALFESRDAGTTWSLVRGLWNHPTRPMWQPGGGGLCMHTIVVDPENRQRITIAVSTAGVFRTDDGGATWHPRNKGVRAQFLPEDQRYPEWGQCVHKVVAHRSKPSRLWLQNHWGLYRSEDGGDTWVDVADGVPSDFGFAMAMHPKDPDRVYIVPLESDDFRCTPQAKLRVYRSKRGKGWEALAKGLPQEGAYETVLRDGLSTDSLDPAGVYFGTRSGKVYGSRDDGDSWSLIADGLPPVTCVKVAVVGGAAAASARPAKQAAKQATQRASQKAGKQTAKTAKPAKPATPKGARTASRAKKPAAKRRR